VGKGWRDGGILVTEIPRQRVIIAHAADHGFIKFGLEGDMDVEPDEILHQGLLFRIVGMSGWQNSEKKNENTRAENANESVIGFHNKKCTRGDSNSHGLPHTHLKRARLPFRHECREAKNKPRAGFVTEIQSGKGGAPVPSTGRFRLASLLCTAILAVIE
jgi:hypothetical protein